MKIFVSYSQKDIKFVKKVSETLSEKGYDVWYDIENIGGGVVWAKEIQKAIRDAELFLLIVSPNSIESDWVQKEFLYASARDIPIVTAQYVNCMMPDWLDATYHISSTEGNIEDASKRISRELFLQQDKILAKKKETIEHPFKEHSSRPLNIFISYADADRSEIRSLYQKLSDDGADVWVAFQRVLPGQEWKIEISEAIRNADVILVCFSSKSVDNKSGYGQTEISQILDLANSKHKGEIYLIPVRLDSCPEHQRLEKYHWVNLFEEDGYHTLLWALEERANQVGATLEKKLLSLWESIKKKNNQVISKFKRNKGRRADDITPDKDARTKIIVAIIGTIGVIVAGFLSSPFIEEYAQGEKTPAALLTITPLVFSPTPSSIQTPRLMETLQPQVELSATPSSIPTKTNTPVPKQYNAVVSLNDVQDFYPDYDCDWMGIGGLVEDASGTPVVGLHVILGGFLNGEPVEEKVITGENLLYGLSGFELFLSQTPVTSINTVWIQLVNDSGQTLSAKTYISTSVLCNQSLIHVRFTQHE